MLSLVLALGLASRPAPAAAQRRQPDTVLSVDVDVLGGALGYARARGPGRYHGIEMGVGGAVLNRVLYGSVDKELFEILHAGVFRRWVGSDRASADVGVRASVFVRSDSSAGHPGIPVFVGLYANALVGGRGLKVGPRILAGMFWEGSTGGELGVYLVPLSGRVSFGW